MSAPEPARLQVEVWSDLVCPWCYIGKRQLERALERFQHRDSVDVTWRSFELPPNERTEPYLLNDYYAPSAGMNPAEIAERHRTGHQHRRPTSALTTGSTWPSSATLSTDIA